MSKHLLFLLSICTIRLAMGLQGFDMCDEGWVLTGYQQFFRAPESCQYLFLYYTSQLVGAIWNSVFGNLGILGFRIFAALTVTATAHFAYKTLEPYFSRWSIYVGIWLVLCCSPYPMVFHHNQLTAFLVTVAAYFIRRTLTEQKNYLAFLAGIILGIAIFARLPNATMMAMGVVFLWSFRRSAPLRPIILRVSVFAGGYLSGIALIGLTMLCLGHLPIFAGALSDSSIAASDPDSTHRISSMLLKYLQNYEDVCSNLFYICALPCLLMLCDGKIAHGANKSYPPTTSCHCDSLNPVRRSSGLHVADVFQQL